MTATALDESASTADGSPASVDPARLEALRRYDVREDLIHPDLDGVVRLAAHIAGTASGALFLPERDGSSVPGRIVATHGCARQGLSRAFTEQQTTHACTDVVTADGHHVGARPGGCVATNPMSSPAPRSTSRAAGNSPTAPA